ncbi:hypothetical protein KKH23_08935 [Patescibacteria group bacterium]|uniref:Uncharacterized protein n=1 Tax=viral metagenome TaxID=1070528 RepID=A0A6M3MEV7_9ZZZZ|nr:hypothetical protein [Patescibacteria group bacterium]
MPNHNEHCKHTRELYGVDGAEIHTWMDEPSQLYGASHRWIRHDLSLIPKKFIDRYGKELAKQIMLDHILLDRKDKTKPVLTGVLNPETPRGMNLALASFAIWLLSLCAIFKFQLDLVPVWVVCSLVWWPVGLPLICKIDEENHIRKAEEKILEDHK